MRPRRQLTKQQRHQRLRPLLIFLALLGFVFECIVAWVNSPVSAIPAKPWGLAPSVNPLPIVILALVGCALSVSGYRTLFVEKDRGQVWNVIRAWRWRYLPGTLATLPGVIVVCEVLHHFAPWTGWGWWHLLGGEGNPAFGEVDLGSSAAGLAISGVLAVTFPLLFAVAAIREARAEEVSFRKGNQKLTVKRRVRRALWFGLVHCIIGIPIYAGFALTVPGLWLDYVYQRGYERAAAQGPREPRRAALLSVLRARQSALEAQAKADERWVNLYARNVPLARAEAEPMSATGLLLRSQGVPVLGDAEPPRGAGSRANRRGGGERFGDRSARSCGWPHP